MEEFGKTMEKVREIRMKIMRICLEDKVEYSYLYHVHTLPPEMPAIITQSFDFVPGKKQDRVAPKTVF